MNGVEEAKAKRYGFEVAIQCIMMDLMRKSDTQFHYHDYIEMLYGVSGSITVIISDNTYELRTGDLMVINSKETHGVIINEDHSRYIVVKFMPQLLYAAEQSAFELEYIMPFLLDTNQQSRVFKNEVLKTSQISTMMFDIFNEWERHEYGYELAMRSDIMRVFLWILRYWHRNHIEAVDRFTLPSDLDIAIQRSIEYANNNFKTVTCEDAANYCNLSYSYFCRSFKRKMNMSFSDYINHLRVSEAQKLLITTDLDMSGIAERTGFSTSSYFIEQFRKRKGISPKHFRLNMMRLVENHNSDNKDT